MAMGARRRAQNGTNENGKGADMAASTAAVDEVCAYLNAKYVKSISSAAPATSEPTTPAEPTE